MMGAVGAATLAAVACEPATKLTSPADRHVRLASLDASTPQISVTGDDGTVYTLDLQSHELWLGTTAIYILTPAQELDVLNKFNTMKQADALGGAVSQPSLGPPGWPGINAASQPDGPGLATTLPAGIGSTPSLAFQVRRSPTGGPNISSHAGTATSANLPGFSAMSADYGVPCLELANAIANLMPAYRAAKAAWFGALALTATSLVDLKGWVPRYRVPGPLVVISTDLAATSLASVQIQLAYLGALYRQGGCFANDWPDASIGGGSIGGTSYIYQCRSESGWEISVDGGTTWQAVAVTMCEYALA